MPKAEDVVVAKKAIVVVATDPPTNTFRLSCWRSRLLLLLLRWHC